MNLLQSVNAGVSLFQNNREEGIDMNVISSFPNGKQNVPTSYFSNPMYSITPGTRVLCLYRVSTDKQLYFTDKNDADIPMQRIACQHFCEKMGWTIVCELQEEGISGYKVRAEQRDKIQLIKDYAKQKRFDILLVFMFDRLGRIADETPFLVEWFVKNGIRVWSTQEGEQRFDSHTDKLTNYIRFWQADGESEKTSIRTSNSMGILTEQGCFTGGKCPYGYSLVRQGRTNKRKQDVYDLVVCEEEALIIQLMFDLAYYQGYGAQRIANHLRENGFKNRLGRNWHPSTIQGIMRNILYTGILRSGERRSPVIESLRIVEDDVFNGVQKMLEERSRAHQSTRSIPLNTRGESLLAGNIFCGHCGSRLCITTSGKGKPRADGTETRRTRYSCQTKTRTHENCNGQTGYTVQKVDTIVETILLNRFRLLRKLDREEVLNTRYRRELQTKQALVKKTENEYSKALDSLQKLKDEIVESLSGNSAFSPELFSSAIQTQEQRCAELREALAEAVQAVEDIMAENNGFDDQFDCLLDWANAFGNANPSARKMIVSRMIERVDVYRNYRIIIKFQADIGQLLDTLAPPSIQSVCTHG